MTKTNQKFKITADQLMQAEDKEWRMCNFYKITDKKSNILTFKRNRAQEHFYKNKANRNIILKARQLGFTTFSVIDMLDDTLFTPNFRSLLISYDADSALDIFDNKVMLAWYNFPWREMYTIDTERANQLQVDFGQDHDGNRRFSSMSVKHSGRSGTYNRAHISEFAKICARYPERAREIITGTIPAVPINGQLDIESTAEGEQGAFSTMFWEAYNRPSNQEKRPTEFKAHFYNWQWDDAEIATVQVNESLPEEFRLYQQKHNEKHVQDPEKFEFMTDQMISYYYDRFLSLDRSWNRLRQEFPTTPEEAFIASGEKFFSMEKIEGLKRHARNPAVIEGDWKYWKPKVSNHVYAIGADVSAGVGRDSSTAVIMDFTPKIPEVVATFASNKIAPDLFAHELKSAGLRYGTCLIAPENNNHGHATLNELKHIYNVDQIYKEVRTNKIDDKETEILGWDTNPSSKPHMMYQIRTAVNDDLIEIPDVQLLTEMRFMDTDQLTVMRDDPEATKHFDLVIALAIAYQMKTNLTQNYQTISTLSTASNSSNPFDGV